MHKPRAAVRGPRAVPARHARPKSGIPLLVLCSRLSREKRPDLAVEALRVMCRGGFPARLVVAGTGPLAAPLRRRARGLPVELVGHIADRSAVADLLGAADVVLAPGPVETFGLAALEALACGTPVVAASTSAVAELVGGGAGGQSRSRGHGRRTGCWPRTASPRSIRPR